MMRALFIFAACTVAALYALAMLAYQLLRHGWTNRAEQIAIALDQSANAACGGWADETLSSRAWREGHCGSDKWARIQRVIDRLFGDNKHCADSYLSELQRAQQPPEIRDFVKVKA